MPVLRHRVVVGWWRIAGPMWIYLLVCVWFAGANAFAQGTASTNAPEKFANSDCLACHLDPNTTRVVNGKTESLVFPTNDFQRSVHANLACVDCHTGIKDLVHDPLGPPNCTPCHEKEAEGLRHEHSRHEPPAGRLRRGAMLGLPRLARHSAGQEPGLAGLQTEPAGDLRQMPQQHRTHQGIPNRIIPRPRRNTWTASTARALLKMGLIVAPSCDDCHGVHDIKRAVDRDSPINHANVAKTCGKCHVGIEETYDKSIHGQLLAKGRPARAGLH